MGVAIDDIVIGGEYAAPISRRELKGVDDVGRAVKLRVLAVAIPSDAVQQRRVKVEITPDSPHRDLYWFASHTAEWDAQRHVTVEDEFWVMSRHLLCPWAELEAADQARQARERVEGARDQAFRARLRAVIAHTADEHGFQVGEPDIIDCTPDTYEVRLRIPIRDAVALATTMRCQQVYFREVALQEDQIVAVLAALGHERPVRPRPRDVVDFDAIAAIDDLGEAFDALRSAENAIHRAVVDHEDWLLKTCRELGFPVTGGRTGPFGLYGYLGDGWDAFATVCGDVVADLDLEGGHADLPDIATDIKKTDTDLAALILG